MKILIIYNLTSGKGHAARYAKKFVKELKSLGAKVQTFALGGFDDKVTFFQKLAKGHRKFDCLLILGGDGTVGRVVDCMLKCGLNYPIATFPVGTANDYAWFLKMPKNVKKVARCIMENKPIESDIARVNGQFVINVIGGGLFTNGYTSYRIGYKKMFGKLAYWFKAFGESFRVRHQNFSIKIDGKEIREELCFFAVLNSSSAGGMTRLGIDAKIDDGIFEFVGFKKCGFFARLRLYLNVFAGKHKTNKNLIYKRGKTFLIKPIHKKQVGYKHCDIDGDCGPNYPIDIRVSKNAIRVFTLNKKLKNL